VLLSLCYVVLRYVLRLAVLGCRSHDFKELEIVVLQHELGILRRRFTSGTSRPDGVSPPYTRPAVADARVI
jgi:hypothetical protein